MPEWLQQPVAAEEGVKLYELLARLTVAFLLGCLSAGIHRLASGQGNRKANGALRATLVLLSVLIAMVTVVIGSNVARAFSLVGTLAIVRFRTVVEDTRDTAFVIYAVVMGMAAGTLPYHPYPGYLIGPLVCTPFVVLAAWIFRARAKEPTAPEGVLVLRLAVGQTPDERHLAILNKCLKRHRLTGLETARSGAALDVTYNVELHGPEQAFTLVSDLTRLEGVQGVELKRI